MRYITRAAIAFDTFVNACLPGGRVDETLSTRADLNKGRWPWSWLYWALDLCFPNHCENARQHDRMRALAFAKFAESKPNRGRLPPEKI